ncbi:hypothetical protein A6046_01130 [[Haemophilus] ducreyi]|nr:hypothetical protein A6036_04535 [[Haemophilus] ducreyi]ANF63887.1 hypothetical protein A6038_07160 [[Haemophilus] ducreyi]ANF64490.1 hypothetical protein A6039_02185 [[Haemophilus] ducreyi]ANF66781.1 hypothetical protein A6040_06855 [[Haemophilus] ducreyi]ANF70998.1 hypothetical protein A6043_06650 [[Haemophilus] ducreyi]
MRILAVLILIGLLNTEAVANTNIREPHVGGVCHVEAGAYFPCIWEKYTDTELICNYWQFLGIDNGELLFEDEE